MRECARRILDDSCPASNVDLSPDKLIGRRKGKIARSTSMLSSRERERRKNEKKRRKIRFSFARVTRPVNRERSGGEKLISISCRLVSPREKIHARVCARSNNVRVVRNGCVNILRRRIRSSARGAFSLRGVGCSNLDLTRRRRGEGGGRARSYNRHRCNIYYVTR